MRGHTPGPWTSDLDSDHGDYVIWGPGPHEFIANIGTESCVAFDVAAANARLIAAAPELLHEASHAIAFLEDLEASDNPACDPENAQAAGFFMALNGLRAAIAKAEAK